MDIMAELQKIFSIVVVDDDSQDREEDEKSLYLIPQGANQSFRYTRTILQSTMQLMGCKPRHAFKISRKVFEVMGNEIPVKSSDIDENGRSLMNSHQSFFEAGEDHLNCIEQENQKKTEATEKDDLNDDDRKQALYKKRISVVVTREKFLDVVCDSLAEYRYMGPNQRADFIVACRQRERKESMTILLCGTSGCGKSTLSSLLLTEELPVPSSDEELDEAPPVDTEDDLSDSGMQHEELQGSVDEESARSDEGDEDLATSDEQDCAHWSDNPEGEKAKENLEKCGLEGKSSEVAPLKTWKKQYSSNDIHSLDMTCKSFMSKSDTLSKTILNDSSLQIEYFSSNASMAPCRTSTSHTAEHRTFPGRSQSLPSFQSIPNYLME